MSYWDKVKQVIVHARVIINVTFVARCPKMTPLDYNVTHDLFYGYGSHRKIIKGYREVSLSVFVDVEEWMPLMLKLCFKLRNHMIL